MGIAIVLSNHTLLFLLFDYIYKMDNLFLFSSHHKLTNRLFNDEFIRKNANPSPSHIALETSWQPPCNHCSLGKNVCFPNKSCQWLPVMKLNCNQRMLHQKPSRDCL